LLDDPARLAAMRVAAQAMGRPEAARTVVRTLLDDHLPPIALALEQLVHTNRIPLMRMVELFTTGPARVLGKERKLAPGEPADITIFSLVRPWTYHVKESSSKSRNSPFDGRSFKGGPAATIVAGKFVHRA